MIDSHGEERSNAVARTASRVKWSFRLGVSMPGPATRVAGLAELPDRLRLMADELLLMARNGAHRGQTSPVPAAAIPIWRHPGGRSLQVAAFRPTPPRTNHAFSESAEILFLK